MRVLFVCTGNSVMRVRTSTGSVRIVPGARTMHWSIPDPAEERGSEEKILAAFRATRDMLEARIRKFLDDLGFMAYAPQ